MYRLLSNVQALRFECALVARELSRRSALNLESYAVLRLSRILGPILAIYDSFFQPGGGRSARLDFTAMSEKWKIDFDTHFVHTLARLSEAYDDGLIIQSFRTLTGQYAVMQLPAS